jgi:hypothetical protein
LGVRRVVDDGRDWLDADGATEHRRDLAISESALLPIDSCLAGKSRRRVLRFSGGITPRR